MFIIYFAALWNVYPLSNLFSFNIGYWYYLYFSYTDIICFLSSGIICRNFLSFYLLLCVLFDFILIRLPVYDACVYCYNRDWSFVSWKLLNDSINFFVNRLLLSWNRYFLDPKDVCLISWILNFIVLPGIDGKLISKFGFILYM
jgi:hypothetical protein